MPATATQTSRNEFLALALTHQRRLLASHPEQAESLKEEAFWTAMEEIINKAKPFTLAYLIKRFDSRVIDGIRREIRERNALTKLAQEGQEGAWQWEDGERVPVARERFDSLDFARWIKRLPRVEAEILRIPRQGCHRFQVNPATDSTAKLPLIP